MKREAYFTEENIARVAGELLSEVRPLAAWRRAPLVPGSAAVLILDMQCYFLDEASHAFIPSARAVLGNLLRLIEGCRSRGVPVVLTRHLNTDEDAGMMARWWRQLIRREDPASRLAPELSGLGLPVVEKTQYDAFYGSGLEDLLRRLQVRQVIIGGVMTNLCCETTARAAFVRGLEVFFLVDGTAGYNIQLQRASLMNLAHGFAVPVLVDEVLRRLCSGGDEG